MRVRAAAVLGALLVTDCGGGSSGPTSAPTAVPPVIMTGVGTFVPASAIDESPVLNSAISPAYSDALPMGTVLTITAPGYLAFRTTAGHLRAKRGAIYLFPSSVEYQQYRTALYGPSPFPTRRIVHWETSGIGVAADATIAADAGATAAMAEGIARFNDLLGRVRSTVRVAPVNTGFMRFRVLVSPVAFACGLASIDGPRTSCTYSFRSIAEARRGEMWLRGLYLAIGPGASPPSGLTGYLDYENYTDLNAAEVAVLRTMFNRCQGARLLSASLEAEDDVTTCFIP